MEFQSLVSFVAAQALTLYKHLALAAVGILATYWLIIFFIRAFWSPLSKFPGPKLAAGSMWWLTYREAIRGESLTYILRQLHESYGSVVRYGPKLLHFSTFKAYSDIYSQSSRWDKDPTVYAVLLPDKSSFGLISHQAARKRREFVLPFFARRNVLRMQEAVGKQLRVLVNKLEEDEKNGRLSDLSLAIRCASQDIMTEICFGEASTKALEASGYNSPLIHAFDDNVSCFVILKTFPLLRRFLHLYAPNWIPGEEEIRKHDVMVAKHVEHVVKSPNSFSDLSMTTLLPYLAQVPSSSKREALDPETLIYEMQAFIVGGGETVAPTVIFGMHGILRQPDLYARLQAELDEVWPNKSDPMPGLEILEQLPLLGGTIKESLRLTHGLVSPIPRIVPDGGAMIDGHLVPGGTSVGVSHTFIHLSPEIFQDPHAFEPRRWMSDSGAGLDKYLLAFSKGPRSCSGINLAWCELYMAFAALLRYFDMDLPAELNDAELKWTDRFQPLWCGRHVRVRCLRRHS